MHVCDTAQWCQTPGRRGCCSTPEEKKQGVRTPWNFFMNPPKNPKCAKKAAHQVIPKTFKMVHVPTAFLSDAQHLKIGVQKLNRMSYMYQWTIPLHHSSLHCIRPMCNVGLLKQRWGLAYAPFGAGRT